MNKFKYDCELVANDFGSMNAVQEMRKEKRKQKSSTAKKTRCYKMFVFAFLFLFHFTRVVNNAQPARA